MNGRFFFLHLGLVLDITPRMHATRDVGTILMTVQ